MKINVFCFPEAARMAPKRYLGRPEANHGPSWPHLGGNLAEDGLQDEVKLICMAFMLENGSSYERKRQITKLAVAVLAECARPSLAPQEGKSAE